MARATQPSGGGDRIWVLASSESCNKAAQQVGRLFDLRNGRLPRRWSLDPGTATFRRGGTALFRIKRAP